MAIFLISAALFKFSNKKTFHLHFKHEREAGIASEEVYYCHIASLNSSLVILQRKFAVPSCSHTKILFPAVFSSLRIGKKLQCFTYTGMQKTLDFTFSDVICRLAFKLTNEDLEFLLTCNYLTFILDMF